MVLLGLVLGFQSGVLSDTRLTKPTDFDVSLRQITDFCAEVSSASGVKFSVDKKVQDLKVDIFVDKRPLAETIDKVAKVLNCEWVPVEKGYRLEMDIPTSNRERNFVKAEIYEREQQLRSKLWACEYVAKNTVANNVHYFPNDFAAEAKQRKLLEPFYKTYLDAHNSGDIQKEKEALSTYSLVQENLNEFYFGRIFLQFDDETRAKFWRGEPFVASTFPNSRYKLYESDMRNTSVHSYGLRDGRSVEAEYQHCIFFRFDPTTGKLISNKLLFVNAPAEYGGANPQGQSSNPRWRMSNQSISESLKKLPFYEDLRSWSEPETTSAKFSQKVDTLTPVWETPWVAYRK